MIRLHPRMRLSLGLLLAIAPVAGYVSPAAAYPNPTIVNRTHHVVHGTIHYALCRADNFTVAAAALTTISVKRGACLITKITATVDGKVAVPYTSLGTGKDRFEVMASGSEYKVGVL